MLTTEFEIIVFIAAFLLGATEGRNLWAWVKGWFSKEVTAVEAKITPAGPTGVAAPVAPVVGHTGV